MTKTTSSFVMGSNTRNPVDKPRPIQLLDVFPGFTIFKSVQKNAIKMNFSKPDKQYLNYPTFATRTITSQFCVFSSAFDHHRVQNRQNHIGTTLREANLNVNCGYRSKVQIRNTYSRYEQALFRNKKIMLDEMQPSETLPKPYFRQAYYSQNFKIINT